MSVINVTQMWSKAGGQITSKQYSPFDLTYKFTAGYMVLAEVGDHEGTIISHPDIPKHGDQHPNGSPSFVTSVTPQPLGPIFWTVTIGYDGEAGEYDIPGEESVEVEWSDTTTTERVDRDFSGNAIVTFNGEPVDGLSVDIADPVVSIRRRFNGINLYAIGAYRHSTNSDTFLGWPPGTARLVGFTAKNAFKFNAPNPRWDVSARIQFRFPLGGATAAQAWYKRWRHEGFYIKDGSVIRRALDNTGEPVAKPVLLKADGTQETNPANAVFKYTQVYGSLPYAALGLI